MPDDYGIYDTHREAKDAYGNVIKGKRGQKKLSGVESEFFTEGRFDRYKDDVSAIREKEKGLDDWWNKAYAGEHVQTADQGYRDLYNRQRAEAGASGYNAGNQRMAAQGIGGMKMDQIQQQDMMAKELQQKNSLDDYLRTQQGASQALAMHSMQGQAQKMAEQKEQQRREANHAAQAAATAEMEGDLAAASAASGVALSAAGALV